jgi:hypothetical protein
MPPNATFKAAPEPTCAQGHPFTFAGQQYLCTDIDFAESGQEIDISDLSIPSGSQRKYAPACLRDGAEVQIEFWGKVPPPLLVKEDISFPGIDLIDGKAICTKRNVKASTGQIVKGSATFRLSFDSVVKTDPAPAPDAAPDAAE